MGETSKETIVQQTKSLHLEAGFTSAVIENKCETPTQLKLSNSSSQLRALFPSLPIASPDVAIPAENPDVTKGFELFVPRQCCRTWYFLDSSNCQSHSRAVRFIFSHSFLSTCQSTCRYLERWFLKHEWTKFDALDYYVLQGANESTQQKLTSSKQNMQGLCTWCTCPLAQSQSGNFIMLPSLVQTQMLELIAAMAINIYKQKNLPWSL